MTTLALDSLRTRLRALELKDLPLLTISLDLRRNAQGVSLAPTVLKDALRGAEELLPDLDAQTLKWFRETEDAVAAGMEAAIRDGAHGYYYVGAEHDDIHFELRAVRPFRNSLRVGDRPGIFELERRHFLEDRPVCVVLVDSHTMEVVRIRFGVEEASAELDEDPHYKRSPRGRTAQERKVGGSAEGAVGGSDSVGGGHSYSTIDRRIQEARRRFAQTAADELEEFMEPDDLMIVSGEVEARSHLLNMLREDVRERAREHPSMWVGQDRTELTEMAVELAIEHQYALADGEAVRWLSGEYGERAVSGIEGDRIASEQGRLGTLIIHDSAVDHFGDHMDARQHASPVDGKAVEDLLWQALEQSSPDVYFTGHDPVLEQHEGVIGVLRW